MSILSKAIRSGNRLLAALTEQEYERLLPNIELAHLEKGELIYMSGDRIRYAHFPLTGMISLLSTTESGSTVEVAMVGNEGILGLPVVMSINKSPYEAMIHIAADTVRIKAEVLKEEFDRGGRLQDFMLRYTHVLIAQIMQSAVCNRFHTVEERLCRWLLIARDRVNSNTIDLTQENIAHMLGSPRTGVTMAAGVLQQSGLIRYSRGKIVILDRQRLSDASCECYRVIKEEFNNLLGP
ncbi:MAG TPA: Crp/Fnr family transcriptional regulator [Pyrinomonadaceae bacterium]